MRSVTVALAVCGLLIAAPAAAVDRLVDDGGVPCLSGALPLHTTISDAVSAASPGETILVCAGTYVDDVTIDKANLTVRGQGLVRLGPLLVAPQDHNIRVTADGVTLQNLDVTGDFLNCNILVDGAGSDIRDLRVRGQSGPSSHSLGICVRQGIGHRVRNNILENLETGIELRDGAGGEVSGNKLSSINVGITIVACAATTVHHNSISVDLPGGRKGVEIAGCDALVTNNTLSGNMNSPTGIDIFRADGAVVTRNQLQHLSNGIQAGRTTGATISFNSIAFSNSIGLLLVDSTGMTVTRNNVSRSADVDCFWDGIGANVLDKNNCGTQDPPGAFD
jgi:parallel beta-helix repeat protein